MIAFELGATQRNEASRQSREAVTADMFQKKPSAKTSACLARCVPTHSLVMVL
jgi:hypothetical protein